MPFKISCVEQKRAAADVRLSQPIFGSQTETVKKPVGRLAGRAAGFFLAGAW